MTRPGKLYQLLLLLVAVCLAMGFASCDAGRTAPGTGTGPIRVGILHSLTGTMGLSETPVKDATLLAIEEINAAGGVLGRPLEPVVVDGQSDWGVFAREAERLITEEKVDVVFGCWTSASRRTVRPIFERHGSLLFYPVQYEGVEQSPNIVYTGAAPNQQIVPAVVWSFEQLKKRRFFLVGSDYVFPRTANAIIRDYVGALGGEIVGEVYIPLGSDQVDDAVRQIADLRPDVILNTINGDSNLVFFEKLRAAGIRSSEIPTISFSIAEPELATMNIADMVGDYAAWNYFMTLGTDENRRFVRAYRNRFGNDRVVSDPMEAAYFGVHLWARAATETGSTKPAEILESIRDLGHEAPGGLVYIDHETRHTWKTVRIGRIREDAQFDIVWSSENPVRPVPYPRTRSRTEWDAFIEGLNRQWKGGWAAPAATPARSSAEGS